MSKRLGIIGGGQLGMMLTEASKNMKDYISKITVLDPTKNCPAAQAGAEQIVGDFKDKDLIIRLAKESDIITYEIESGDSEVLKSLKDVEINPSPETLQIIQDKYHQKMFLDEKGIPVTTFSVIESKEDLKLKINDFGLPALLKTRRDAYDGRGNYKIKTKDEITVAYDYFSGKKTYLEKFIDFKMEVSVIAARNTKGEIATYPVVENMHEQNILRTTIAPARVSSQIQKNAADIAEKTMDVLKGAGVFGIEMFVTKADEILINEIAPRVHNSGHHTINSSETSQFEQHLRAIMGLPLGSTRLIKPTVMYNILGSTEFKGEYEPLNFNSKNIFLKMYGKKISKPLRKLGHVNLVAHNSESVDDLIKRLEKIKYKFEVRQKKKLNS